MSEFDNLVHAVALSLELHELHEVERTKAIGEHFAGEPFERVIASLAFWLGNQLGQQRRGSDAVKAQLGAFSLIAAQEAKRILATVGEKDALQ